jgi:predicted flap endonuclease-1-like 5' DNA nuclease
MGVRVKDLKGMTEELIAALTARGIRTSDQMLEATRQPKQRKELAILSGTDPRALLELANRADLARVKGVGGVYSDLLEKAGVDTVKELATRRPDNLYTRILETNSREQLTRQPPTAALVESWVEQARELPKLLTY